MAPPLAEIGDDGIAAGRLVGDQCVEGDLFNEWRNADDCEALFGQQHETHESADRIGEARILVLMPPLTAIA
ncbi:hypothetical protein QA640_36535 [Bradyrhizobium sp. CB82]|uniref:hypothetical protein n=1 Tax=Bradyrhizobium sp. CB82 TaxID=3039159 RepID=UPI0024B25939|nr:hypothetical protein [Bradyrhizobium sp. CB82]WFU39794.1 hypothetical protein QA640_36535 [Bradyrhizobium sp. CB82]